MKQFNTMILRKISFYIILALVTLLPLQAWGNLDLAPPNFDIPGLGERGIFVDFIRAEYNLTYDLHHEKAIIHSIIDFNIQSDGMPLFDLIPNPENIVLDGVSVTQEEIETPTMDNFSTQLRVVRKNVSPGTHRIEMDHTIKASGETGLYFLNGAVKHGFYMSDFFDRQYLEQYLPTNLEYDTYEIKMNVDILGSSAPTSLYANGEIEELAPNHWSISFPSYFNCSALFFNLRPKETTNEIKFDLTRIDGSILPVTLFQAIEPYPTDMVAAEKTIRSTIPILENRFGVFPHPQLLLYLSSDVSGGMEYSGAAISNEWSLPHELAHSYFGRGVMSANGNSGWIDEAMATWVSGLPDIGKLPVEGSNIAGTSPYLRSMYNDHGNDGYGVGSALMDYIDTTVGKLDPFILQWNKNHMHQVINNSMLSKDLNHFYLRSFDSEFKKYIFGPNTHKRIHTILDVPGIHATRKDIVRIKANPNW
jgi:hypothetical protein